MDNVFITKKNTNGLSGEIIIPPDKSISHRSLILGALTKGKIKISNISLGFDCISTLKILNELGVRHKFLSKRELFLDATGAFIEPKNKLDCGNSGTTTRLMAGLLASKNFKSELFGDESLSKRPMKRIIEPLELMGAKIKSNDNKMPLIIEGGVLKGIEYKSPIPSAQIKSALLIAGLNAKGKTKIWEKTLSRNHSELMLEYLGANIKKGYDDNGYFVEVEKSSLIEKDIEIPGDISSAAFFMVAGAIVKNSDIVIKNVGINPTRTGILDVFDQAKINYKLLNKRMLANEPVSDIQVSYSENIEPFEIKGDLVPRLIDEIPILAVLATRANGKTVVKDAKDLRNKESDRIKAIVEAFMALGVEIEEKEDGFIIQGKREVKNSIELETFLDHRLAMSYYVLSLITKKELKIKGFDCINTSFPEFLNLMKEIQK